MESCELSANSFLQAFTYESFDSLLWYLVWNDSTPTVDELDRATESEKVQIRDNEAKRNY